MTPGTYPVVIGAGGAASPISSGDGSANKGSDTTFDGITGLGGGVAAPQYAQPQAASPFSTALSTALGVGGLYGKIFK